MRKFCYSILIILPALCFSCATIVNGPTTTYAVETSNGEKVVFQGDTLRHEYTLELDRGLTIFNNIYNTNSSNRKYFIEDEVLAGRMVLISVPRSREPLRYSVIAEDAVEEKEVKSTLAGAFGANICFPPGFLIDLANDRRWDYPNSFSPDFHERMRAAKKDLREKRFYDLHRKGNIKVSLALPYTNFLSAAHPVSGGRVSSAGFIGFGGGIEYFHRDMRSVEAYVETLGYLPVPLVDIIIHIGPHEQFSNLGIYAMYNVHLRRFSFSAGIGALQQKWWYGYYDGDYVREDWSERHPDEPFPAPTYGTEPLHSNRWSVGPVLKAYVNLAPSVKFGVIYRPVFYTFGDVSLWSYGHVISLDLRFNYNIWRPRKLRI